MYTQKLIAREANLDHRISPLRGGPVMTVGRKAREAAMAVG
jgi:hypothetical protein